MDVFLPIAKEAVVRKVADRVRTLGREYVARWISEDLWIVDALARKYGREARAWKGTVLETFDMLSAEEILAACRGARPDLADLWEAPQARAKVEEELRRGRALVAQL